MQELSTNSMVASIPSLVLVSSFKLWSRTLSGLAILAGGIVLASWIFHIPALAAPQAVMTPDAALAVLLLGISLSAFLKARDSQTSFESLSYAAAACIVAFLTLALLVLNINPLLGAMILGSSGGLLSQATMDSIMATNAAIEILILSLGVIMLQFRGKLFEIGQGMVIAALVYALFGVVAFLYETTTTYRAIEYVALGLPVALSCLSLCASAICGCPEQTIAAILVSEGAGGRIARRLFAQAVVATIVLGWLVVVGKQAGLYEANLGTAAFAVLLLSFFCSLTVAFARRIEVIHGELETTRKNLERSEEQSHLTLDNLYEAFIGVDAANNICTWNKQAEAIFGWTKEEIIGKSLIESLVAPSHRQFIEQLLGNFSVADENSTFGKQLEIDLLHRDQRAFPAEISVTPIRVDAQVRFCVLARDVSERKRLAQELAHARDQAMEASRLKSEFVANISHEIRTPLNAIVGLSDLLLRRQLNGDVRDFAATIHDSADSLLNIVNDILDYSKIEAGKLNLEITDIDVVAVVEGAAELVAGRAREKGLSLSVFIAPDVPRFLKGDPGRIRQVLLNLLANSIKFTDSGEVVTRATVEEIDDKSAVVCFSVTDTGIGIEEEVLARMFEPFTQADGSVTRRYGGTGLGLSISKRLVELMGGQIGAESTPQEGSNFWFKIRLDRPAKRPQIFPTKKVFHDVRLLIVNGPAHASEIIQAYASSWGIRCDTVATGEEALHLMRREAAANAPYDLAIVDFQLTHSDALALAHSIGKYEDLRHTKLILVSSFDDHILAQDALQAGFSAFLAKPVKQSRMYDCFVNLLTSNSERDALRAHRTTAPAAQTEAASMLSFQGELPGSPSQSPLSAAINETHASEALAPVVESARREERVVIGGQDKLHETAPILVVEDNATNQKVALLQLSELGYRAYAVSNGTEALEELKRRPYSLILMDCQMPDMDGFEATRQIRRQETLSGMHIPIVAMTAHAMSEDRYKCLSAGMDDYISKPVKRQRLKAVLERFLSGGGCDPAEDAVKPGERGQRTVELPKIRPEPIDFSVLLNEFSADETTELLNTFVASAETLLNKLSAAVSDRDLAQTSALVHELKSASSAVGAHELAQLSCDLELATKEQDWTKIRQYSASIISGFDRLRNYLNAHAQV